MHIRLRRVPRPRASEGAIGSRQVPSYVEEPGVDPSRNRLPHPRRGQRPRWDGVPFALRSGKALPGDSAEIEIQFRPLPRYLLDQLPGVGPNVLRIGLTEQYMRLSTTRNGPEQTAETGRLSTRPAGRHSGPLS